MSDSLWVERLQHANDMTVAVALLGFLCIVLVTIIFLAAERGKRD